MNFSLTPTLEHIALVHVTAKLWNNHDIRLLLMELLNSPFFAKTEVVFCNPPQSEIFIRDESHSRDILKKWHTAENRVKENVSQLMIPTTLKEKILSFILPIGLEILRWMGYHRYCYSLDLDLPNEFYWTSLGAIDKKKTASILIKDESINITTRYKLACIYCLEDDIQKLWKKIPKSRKRKFYNGDPSRIKQKKLVVFWTYFIKGEIAKVDRMIKEKYNQRSSYQFAFKGAVDDFNKEAAKYFLEKLTTEKDSLAEIVIGAIKTRHRNTFYRFTDSPIEYLTDVVCFLLSQMNEEQQAEVFKRDPVHMLKGLLHWPWQNIFLETAKRVCNFLPEIHDYIVLLLRVADKVRNGYMDYNYQKMFEKLWQQYPDTIKSSLINTSNLPYIICGLLCIKDEENIKLIFQNVSVIEKRNLVFNEKILWNFENLICSDDWDVLKSFIQLCISSKDDIIEFKQNFLEHVARRVKVSKDKLDIFCNLLDDFVCEFDKKKNSNGDDNDSAKGLNIFP